MLGKGLESLIPAGGYQKPTDYPAQNNSGTGAQPQSIPPLSHGRAYSSLPHYQNPISNQASHQINAEGHAPLSYGYQDARVEADNRLAEPSSNQVSQQTISGTPKMIEPQPIDEAPSPAKDALLSPVTTLPTEAIPASQIAPIIEASPSLSPLSPPAQDIVSVPALAASSPMLQNDINIPNIPAPVVAPSIDMRAPLDVTPTILAPAEFLSQAALTPSPNMPVSVPPVASSPAIDVPTLVPAPVSAISPTAPIMQAPLLTQAAAPIATSFLSPLPSQATSIKPGIKDDLESDYSRKQSSVFHIEVDKIFPNPHQPRRYFDEDALSDLANSIREFGIIQPLVVTKTLTDTDDGTNVSYQLIAGERRLMAAKKVGLRTVPVVIRQVMMDRERLELAIIENIQRENLNPLESARGYARLQDEFGLTQREIAIRIGKSRETIANSLRLLNLPSEIQQALSEGKINESHARLLLQINDISRQKDMFQSILRVRPSVRALKETIKRDKTHFVNSYLNPELISLQSRLEELLGTKAEINDDGGKGKITINYYSTEELNALINRLSGEIF